MAEENLHMDDAFKQMADDFKVNYDSSFWNDAAAKLNDANLDDAFRAAAQNVVVSPTMPQTGNVDDIFMDAAFAAAATDQSVVYNADFFKQFQESEAGLQMDEAFQTAAAATVVDYMPNYWNDADAALIAEGLHYEYDSAYWAEAKKLLDKSDRAAFFIKWTSIAGLLLLISFSAQFIGISNDIKNGSRDLTQQSIIERTVEQNLEEQNGSASDFISENGSIENGSINNENLAVNEQNFDFETTTQSFTNEESGTATNELVEGNLTFENNNLNLNPESNITLNSDERTLVNANPILFKSPIFSMDENVLSYNFKTNEVNAAVQALDKSLINIIANERSFLPELEINRGQDRPKGMHSFSVLASAGVGNRWADEKLSPALRTSIGAGYNYAPTGILRNFDVGTSLQLNHVRQNNLGVEKRSSVYEYHGGVSKYWYKLQLRDMIYANTNFTIGYRLGAKSKVNVGLGMDYLLAVGSNMSFKDKAFETVETVDDNWGVKDGINVLDIKVGIGYEYLISNKLALTLNANYGLMDRTDDEFLNQVKIDKEMNVMVGFKYTLFRKI